MYYKNKRKKTSTDDNVFVLTLALETDVWQRDKLNTLFASCNKVKNALIRKELNKLNQLEQTREWKFIQSNLSILYDKKSKLKKGNSLSKEDTLKLNNLCKQRNALLKKYKLSKNSFEKDVSLIYKHFKSVHSAIAQKISYSVWSAFEDYLFNGGKHIHFSKYIDFLSIEGKSNLTGIRFVDGFVSYSTAKFKPIVIRVRFDKKDKYCYETQALQRPIHFCKLIRKWYEDGFHYFVQLVLGGYPPIKIDTDTGIPLHCIGTGNVGNDIGTQTLATVADTKVQINILAESVDNIEKELRIINRAMDLSRRSTNPDMFNADGTVKAKNELSPNLLHENGKRKWYKSKNYKRLSAKRRFLYRKQRELRIQQHCELANKLIELGDKHYIEKMSFKGLAKRSKNDLKSQKGKLKSKKRFGKSIANKAPATFVKIYEQKVKFCGGEFFYIDTFKVKASQYNHETKICKKKKLFQRWNTMQDGTKIQRDLYSAFLIQHTNETLDGFDQFSIEIDYPAFLEMHNQEIEHLKTKILPTSVGL